MSPERRRRLAAAALIAAAGLAAALAAGAPLLAATVVGLAGAAAGALLAPRDADARRIDSAPGPTATTALSDILAALDDPILLIRERKVLIANPAARRLLGEHIAGVDARLAIRHPAAAEHLTGAAAQPVRIELAGLGEEDRRWELAIAPLADGTRMVRLTDRSAAFASEQMRTDFVANASHELRTPLASLLGFLETLEDDEAAEDKKTRSRFLGIMQGEARRMQRLVDDLISLSRIEAGRFSVPREPVPLLPLVEEVRLSCGRMAAERRNEIVVDNRLSADPVVPGDRPQLLQLLQNLLVNAIKYGRAGEPVTVRFEEGGAGMLRVGVIDRGEGIAPEHLPRLTERFYRVEPSRSRSIGGTGLGLAIVKHIVGRHRGRLEIASKPGQGTRVDIWLPRAAEPMS